MTNQPKTITRLAKIALLGTSLIAFSGASDTALAQPKKNAGLGVGAIQSTERALGKKLTASQKTAIIAAAKAREKANGQARKKNMKAFRVQLAKIAGVPLTQLQAKEKAARKPGKAAKKS